jgi:hypothetical protein
MDAFRALDSCHGQTLRALATLEALLGRLERAGLDAEARAMAAEIVHHFSTVCRQHHEDEERHVFSKLALSAAIYWALYIAPSARRRRDGDRKCGLCRMWRGW